MAVRAVKAQPHGALTREGTREVSPLEQVWGPRGQEGPGPEGGPGAAAAGTATHHLIHFELSVGLGAEELLGARGHGELLDQVGEEQEVVEEEAVQLLVALGLVQLPAVQQLPRPQAVGEGVENELLQEEETVSV